MTRYVSGACIDENGRATGGKAGDQTGRELCVHTLASSGSWSRILRPPRNTDKIVKQAYAAAANDLIGYDQSQRTTLYNQASKTGFDLSSVKVACETDCSALVAVLCIGAGFAVSRDMYTGNERAALQAAGFKDMPYTEAALQPGDILWRSGHTVVYVGTNKGYVAGTTSDTVVAKLVDLSHHNASVDLAKVKKAGYHVILKCGEGTSFTDGTFEKRAKECERLGIPYGVYYYARAKTAQQARNEAARCLRIIAGRKLSYPVYYDIEEESLGSVAANVTREFCLAIEKAGRWAGVYTGDSYWQAHLTGLGDRFTKWIARYGVNDGKPSYKPVTKKYDVWQYSSNGTVDGVGGRCDVNNVYRDLVKAVTGKSSQKPSGGPSGASTDEVRYRARLYNGKWLPEVEGGSDYAGVLGQSIAYIAVRGVKRYRVKTSRGWLPWVTRYDASDLDTGCAGDGSPILALQVDDRSCRYAAHTIGGKWLPDMVGLSDTSGSSDTFAGNGRKIDGIRMRRVR